MKCCLCNRLDCAATAIPLAPQQALLDHRARPRNNGWRGSPSDPGQESDVQPDRNAIRIHGLAADAQDSAG